MTITQPPSTHGAGRSELSRARTPVGVDRAELDQLLEENKQLRALVVQLSDIAVRNVLDRSLPGLPRPRVGK